jgi:hypothetical protein
MSVSRFIRKHPKNVLWMAQYQIIVVSFIMHTSSVVKINLMQRREYADQNHTNSEEHEREK